MIIGKRIYLRAFEIDDYVLIHKWRNNPEINYYLVGNVFMVSSEREKNPLKIKYLTTVKTYILPFAIKNLIN